jgi:acetyl-CoA C-acetyltransferase
MTDDVVIAGIGQIPVGEHWNTSLRSHAVQAILAARREVPDLEPEALIVGNMLASVISHQANLGSLICDWANLLGIEAPTVEASGASGGAALRLGYLAVTSGMSNVALVVGVEKVTDAVSGELDPALTQMMDGDYEAMPGLTPTGQAALIMQRYMHTYHLPAGAFAGFSINAHANAVHNPNAMFRKAISRARYDEAEMISDPVNMMDVAPAADGAAAVILTRSDLLPKNYPYPVVHITGSSNVIDSLALHDRPDPMLFQAINLSAGRAYTQAGITPADVDLFELDDAYSVYAALALEGAGFAEPGKGWELAQDGSIIPRGKIPICTMGGSKSRGNPIGAVGVYQAVEAVLQLRGQAGSSQVPGAKIAMLQNWGGPASTVVTHILDSN